MANETDGSLREFAEIIQEKAGPVPEPHTGQPASEVHDAGDIHPPTSLSGWWIAGITAGLGIVIGYLLGKRRD